MKDVVGDFERVQRRLLGRNHVLLKAVSGGSVDGNGAHRLTRGGRGRIGRCQEFLTHQIAQRGIFGVLQEALLHRSPIA